MQVCNENMQVCNENMQVCNENMQVCNENLNLHIPYIQLTLNAHLRICRVGVEFFSLAFQK
jgi:hypothetical protein